jgi:hypothetical protein
MSEGANLGGPVRILAWTILGTMLAAALAWAQTYDPNYPICLQVFGIAGNYIACGYTSMAQCAQSASGRAAQCLVNPYFVGANRRPHTGGEFHALVVAKRATERHATKMHDRKKDGRVVGSGDH